jgi:hypothetical protein
MSMAKCRSLVRAGGDGWSDRQTIGRCSTVSRDIMARSSACAVILSGTT